MASALVASSALVVGAGAATFEEGAAQRYAQWSAAPPRQTSTGDIAHPETKLPQISPLSAADLARLDGAEPAAGSRRGVFFPETEQAEDPGVDDEERGPARQRERLSTIDSADSVPSVASSQFSATQPGPGEREGDRRTEGERKRERTGIRAKMLAKLRDLDELWPAGDGDQEEEEAVPHPYAPTMGTAEQDLRRGEQSESPSRSSGAGNVERPSGNDGVGNDEVGEEEGPAYTEQDLEEQRRSSQIFVDYEQVVADHDEGEGLLSYGKEDLEYEERRSAQIAKEVWRRRWQPFSLPNTLFSALVARGEAQDENVLGATRLRVHDDEIRVEGPMSPFPPYRPSCRSR